MYSGTEVKPPQAPTSSYTKHLPISFPAGSAYPVATIDVNLRFGLRLRSLRREHHWTQLDMAVTLGINRSYISEVERGHKSISLGLLEVIALGFHMSISDLLNGI
jgi:DNA-binding XRE family transcriptional regulator